MEDNNSTPSTENESPIMSVESPS